MTTIHTLACHPLHRMQPILRPLACAAALCAAGMAHAQTATPTAAPLAAPAQSTAATPAPTAPAATSKAPAAPPRDEFFWLGEINKASAVINTDEGLLDKSFASTAYAGISKVLADGNRPGGKRPRLVITLSLIHI